MAASDDIAVRLQDASGGIVSEASSPSLAMLDVRYGLYQPGDPIIVDCPPGRDIGLMLDEALAPSIVRIPAGHMDFRNEPPGLLRETPSMASSRPAITVATPMSRGG